MRSALIGFLAAYTILITAFASGMYNGRIASISQACVERVGVVPQDYVTQLEGKR